MFLHPYYQYYFFLLKKVFSKQFNVSWYKFKNKKNYRYISRLKIGKFDTTPP